uniref:Uncharacterized protein n=1 Tax=Fagus sylvatica TaxID=28930 RepID=A0A2N9J594_FAGSY
MNWKKGSMEGDKRRLSELTLVVEVGCSEAGEGGVEVGVRRSWRRQVWRSALTVVARSDENSPDLVRSREILPDLVRSHQIW